MGLKINIKRLEKNLNELAKIGMNSRGGIDRALGDESDRIARKWIEDYWESKVGLNVETDAIANMWAERKGCENIPPLVIGSHHDAVPNGGKYDGALGVLLATEIIQTLNENNIETRHPIKLVSFTGEEPNPFNVSTLGSKVLSGRLKCEDLKKLTSYKDGGSLEECIDKIGGNINKADEILVKPNDISAFIECHIEQGRRLLDKGLPSACVSCITGIYRENITIRGEANHAGTTVMNDRHDAFLAAAELGLGFEQLVKAVGKDEVVGTIGYATVFPNAASIIPGVTELILEIRTTEKEIKDSLIKGLGNIVCEIEKKRRVKIERRVNLDQGEMQMDPDVMSAINRGIEQENIPSIELVSMAGHDAANMERVTKSGMIFVQSNGKSHCPEEDTYMDNVEITGNGMLNALLILDKELDQDEYNI